MSKTNDLSTAITKLRQCGETVRTVSDTLAAMLNEQGNDQEAEPITLEDVRGVLAAKSVQGHTAQVQALIHKRGVEKLSQVNPAHYADLLAEAEAL
ncbi:MAG: hypothetical protein JW795_19505 [Chitinivibrionales bacterium]|nr:hypothetical protein [Chitinivibrionales bacterium]